MRRRRWRSLPLAALAAALLAVPLVALGAVSPAAVASSPPTPDVVSAVPAAGTPNINNGIVYAFAQVGATMVVGGMFTTISPADDSSQVDSHDDVAAFDVSSDAISATFAPSVDGTVNALLPGPASNEVYVGGAFNTIDGVTTKLALLNVATGQMVSGWTAPAMNDAVNSLLIVNGQLIVAGNFTTVNGTAHKGLVSLNPTTGAVTNYVGLSFTGHHNYGTQCDPTTETCAKGVVGIRSITANPAGTKLIALGNFIHVDSADRSQIAMINLSQTKATLDTQWSSEVYSARCFAGDFDSNVRTVAFSPNGSYFAVVATGASNLSPNDVNPDGTYSP